jgi:Protein of unknown function (DUF2975)
MKVLGKRSLSTVLAVTINIVWWLEWIAMGAMLVAIILAFTVKQTVKLDVPVSMAPAAGTVVNAEDALSPTGMLFPMQGHFSFQIDTNLQNAFILVAGTLIVFGFLMRVTYHLKLIFLSFKQGQPFNEANFERIRNIGLALIAFCVLQFIFNIGLRSFLTTHFKWPNGMALTYSFNVNFLVTGLILIVLSEIFKLGVFLEEDKNLTI